MGLSQSVLREILYYDKDTGDFVWLSRDASFFSDAGNQSRWNTRFAGKTAGSVSSYGYTIIGIFGRSYRAQRLAFMYVTGTFPDNDVDHINGDRSDNRWGNLRAATRIENNKNKVICYRNRSGLSGVGWRQDRRCWEARINEDGVRIHLGSFSCLLDAAGARINAEREYGYHQNHGKRADHRCQN